LRSILRAGGFISSSSSHSRHRGAHLRHDFPEVYSNSYSYSFRSKIPRIFLFLIARLLRYERRERENQSQRIKKAYREKPIYHHLPAKKNTTRVRSHRHIVVYVVVIFIAKTKSEKLYRRRFDRASDEHKKKKKNKREKSSVKWFVFPKDYSREREKSKHKRVLRTMDRDRVTRYPRRLAIVCIFLVRSLRPFAYA
jgi:hypothetical protein